MAACVGCLAVRGAHLFPGLCKSIAPRFLIRASPGRPSLYARSTHASYLWKPRAKLLFRTPRRRAVDGAVMENADSNGTEWEQGCGLEDKGFL